MVAVIFFEFFSIRRVGLPNQDCIVLVSDLAQLFQLSVDLGQFVVVLVLHVGIAQVVLALEQWVVVKIRILKQEVDGTETRKHRACTKNV